MRVCEWARTHVSAWCGHGMGEGRGVGQATRWVTGKGGGPGTVLGWRQPPTSFPAPCGTQKSGGALCRVCMCGVTGRGVWVSARACEGVRPGAWDTTVAVTASQHTIPTGLSCASDSGKESAVCLFGGLGSTVQLANKTMGGGNPR